jgi:filamentous hemagglutinin family protein
VFACCWLFGGMLWRAQPCRAQIIPDATLLTPSIVESFDQGQTIAIDGGSLAGSNLFHSFQDFSISADVTVELLAPRLQDRLTSDVSFAPLVNIFLRVTGDRSSQIDGQLIAPGSANLFLLNPNGIQFGGDARLDIGGMFVASTADRLDFADGISWATGSVALAEPPLLSLSVPIGLQFNPLPLGVDPRSGIGEIAVFGAGQREILAGDEGSEPLLAQIRTANTAVDVDSLSSLFATVGIAGEGLEVPTGQAIALVGRNVTIAGGLLRVPAGAIVLASPTAGSVELTSDVAQPLRFDDVTAWGDVLLTDAAAIDTSGNSSGNLTLRGENLTIANGTIIFARPLGNGDGSELLLEANHSIRFQGIQTVGSKIQDNALLGGTIGEASGSNITLRAGEVSLGDGSVISSITFSGSQGGNVTIQASDRVLLDGNGLTAVRCCSRVLADSRGTGNAGNIAIETPFFQLIDGAQFASRAFQSGNGGQITIRAEDVELHGAIPITSVASVPVTNFFGTRFPSGLFTVSRSDSTGDSGSIQIDSQRILVNDLAEIQVTTFGSGQGGDLTLNASDSLTLRSQGAVVLTEPETTTVIGDQSFVRRDPSLTAFSELTLISAGATSQGNGGSLRINTGQLNLINGNVLVGTIGEGNAGQLWIEAQDQIHLDRSTLLSGSFGLGDGGDLQLTTPNLQLTNGSLISAATALNGTGAAGSVQIQVMDQLHLRQESQISATTEQGNGGNVTVFAGDFQLRDRSLLSAASQSADRDNPGNGGNLTLNSETIVLFDQSQISANALVGNGGNIEIITQGLYQDPTSRITASSDVGLAGVVEVSTPDIDSSAGLVQLNGEVMSTNAFIVDHCRGTDSRFTIPNRGGFPDDPFTDTEVSPPILRQPTSLAQERSIAAISASASHRVSEVPQVIQLADNSLIQEARGWLIADGHVTLDRAQPWSQTTGCIIPSDSELLGHPVQHTNNSGR